MYNPMSAVLMQLKAGVNFLFLIVSCFLLVLTIRCNWGMSYYFQVTSQCLQASCYGSTCSGFQLMRRINFLAEKSSRKQPSHGVYGIPEVH